MQLCDGSRLTFWRRKIYLHHI